MLQFKVYQHFYLFVCDACQNDWTKLKQTHPKNPPRTKTEFGQKRPKKNLCLHLTLDFMTFFSLLSSYFHLQEGSFRDQRREFSSPVHACCFWCWGAVFICYQTTSVPAFFQRQICRRHELFLLNSG